MLIVKELDIKVSLRCYEKFLKKIFDFLRSYPQCTVWELIATQSPIIHIDANFVLKKYIAYLIYLRKYSELNDGFLGF